MAFTTWQALYDDMLNSLADGSYKVKSYTLADGTSYTYRDFDEFKKALDFAKSQADKEGGTFSGRVYAGQGGGGRW